MSEKKSNSEKQSGFSFYVGTYTYENSEGIYKYLLRSDGSLEKIGLVAKAENPSFLAKQKETNVLVAVNELEQGRVESYVIQEDTLVLTSQESSGGSYPCHITISPTDHVLAANYGSGTVGVHKLNADGVLSELLHVQEHQGSGDTDRQKGPHAHSVWIEDNNNIISADLGTNELWFSRILADDKLVYAEPSRLNLAPDSGPRHLAMHQNGKWLYVLNELSSTITWVEQVEGNYIKKQSISMLPTDFTESSSGADIHLSSDGRFLYASNRGHNSIVIYEVDHTEGSLTLIGFEGTRGKTPRNFALSPDERFLVVANQDSSTIVSFERNAQNGTLQFVNQIEAPTPVCILF